jgi:hypothetical protein
MTGTGTSRTATASTGTPFAVANIDVGGTIDSDSYLRTPLGVYRITARTSDTVVTITTPSTYSNESAVAFSVHKRLFQVTTGEINNTASAPLYAGIQLYTINSVQPAYTILVGDKLAIYRFAKTTSLVTKYLYFAYGGTTRYSRVDSPLMTLHGDLAGLQGGTGAVPTEQYYHLTLAQHTIATQPADTTNSGYLTTTDWDTFNEKVTSHNLLSAVHLDSTTGSALLGDLIYADANPKWTKLAGNTTTTKKFLVQTGTGAISAVPAWDTLVNGDIPAILAGKTSYNGLVITADTGVITTGTWNATLLTGQYGGTGVANTGKTITLGGNLTLSGAFATTLTVTNTTTLTLPVTGTLVTLAGTEILNNKRINPRVYSEASSATPTPDSDSYDAYIITALAEAATWGAPTGTPVQEQSLELRIKDNATARALSWNAIYRAGTDIALPSTTVLSKTMYLGFKYNSTDSKWDLIAYVDNI